MRYMALIFAGGAGLAALAMAAPTTAQYYYGYGSTQFAAQRCAAAVQNRLSYRNYGAYGAARVLTVTRVQPRRSNVRVTGLATSGRYAYYDRYDRWGVGMYGMLGSAYARPADLSFRCIVDYRGRIRDIDINRRR